MGFIFNPHLGTSLRPMLQAFSGLTRIVAIVFALNGLFPKNHPILTEDARGSLTQVMRTAWGTLEFNKNGVPRVLLFFGVALGLFLTALSIVTALVLGLVGHAHAASTSVFTTPNTSTDLAYNWLNFLFSPSSSTQTAAGTNLASPVTGAMTGLQAALVTALGIYSGAMLVIAAIILFYHLSIMVVNTAHKGVPMGDAGKQIWAPLRLVIAIGLLVPLNGGLNCGQLIVLEIAQLGSALASNVWSGFATALAADTKMPEIPIAADIGNASRAMAEMYACEYAFNYRVAEEFYGGKDTGAIATATKDNINGWAWTADGGSKMIPSGLIGTGAALAGTTVRFQDGIPSDGVVCGSVTFPPIPQMSDKNMQPVANSIYQDTVAAFQSANGVAVTTGIKVEPLLVHGDEATLFDNTLPTLPKPQKSDIDAIVTAYEKGLQKVATDASTANISQVMTKDASQGWIAAGAFFNGISVDVAEVNYVMPASLPQVSAPPDPSKITGRTPVIWAGKGPNYGYQEKKEEVDVNAARYAKVSEDLSLFDTNISYVPASATPVTSTDLATELRNLSSKFDKCVDQPTECILEATMWIAQYYNVWGAQTSSPTATAGSSTANTGSIQTGVVFDGKTNPLLQMAQWGHNSINAGLYFFDYGLYCLAGSVFPWAAGMLGGIAGFLFFIGVAFFTMGAVVAYFIPFLPFMHFFFNTITWFACVVEAIVGIPMVALAQLNPDGEGLAGQAKTGYSMIFSLLLRPVMMIFGLIAGLMLMFIGAGLLNMLYNTAVSATGGVSTSNASTHLAVSQFMYTVIYVLMLVSIANHSFALIGILPDKAMGWFGTQGQSGLKMGEPKDMERGVGLATAYMGDRMTGQLSKVGSGLQALGKGMQQSAFQAEKERGKDDAKEEKKPSGPGLAKRLLFGNLAGPGIGSAYQDSYDSKKENIVAQKEAKEIDDKKQKDLIAAIEKTAGVNQQAQVETAKDTADEAKNAATLGGPST